MNKKWFLNASLSAAVGLALAAPWATTQADELYLQAQELKSGDNKEGTIFTFPSVVEWVDNTGDNPVTKIDFEGLNSIAPGTTNFEWTKAGTSPNNGNEGFAFVIKIEKPWKKGQAGEAVILSLKVGKSAEIPKDITIPEFVWAHDKERSGDEAFPSYKVVGIADTVFRVFTKAGDNGLEINSGNDGYTKLATSSFTGFKNLWVSPRIPKILGSGKLKTYGLFQGEVYNASNYVSFESVLIQPTWAVLENNQKLTSGTAYYRNSTGQVEGAESVVRDLQFGLSGDNRDLEVSKADLDAISKFIAVATPVKAAANSKNKGQLIKLSTATLHIGLGLKPASGAFDTPEDGGDVLPNKWLSLGADAFKADSLSWRFGSIIIHNEVSGNLGAAGFASISPIHKLKEPKDNVEASVQAPDFELIDLSTVNLKIPNSGVFAIEGDGLFQGLTIGVPGASTAVTGGLVLPAGLQAIGNKWFKDATIFAIGDKVDATSKAVTVTNLGASVTFIGDEAFRGAFIGNFDKLGTALGTPATYEDNHSGEYPYLKNGLTIGKSAFKGYKIYLKLKDASSFEANKAAGAFSLESFKRATVIGDSAFADLTHAHLTFDGTNVEADASGATTEHHFYPVTNFGKLTLVNTLGKGVFAEDHIALAASDVVNVPQTTDALKAILFPSTYLASSPSAIFKNAAFVVGGTSGQYITAPTKIEEYLDEGINFKTSLDTFAYKAFKIGEKALPGDGIALDAFPEDTIYVSYKSFEKWKYALTGSKLVVDYGFTGISETDPDKFLVKIVAGSAGVVTNTTKTLGLFEITYNFARNSRARTISFYNAYAAGKRHYSITGPTSAIGAVPGFLTLKADSTPKAIEITEAFSEDGLVLDPFTPAGLYVISVYGFSEPTTADINNDNVTGKETYLLRVLPADLLRYTADTVELGYVGADNVAAALKHKFTIPFFAGLIHNEYGDEEDLSYDGADIKVYDEAALALKADGEVVDNVLVVKGKGSYVNELAIPLKYTPRSIAQVDFSIPPVDFKIGDKEFLIPGDLKFAVTEEDTIYTLTIPQTGGEDDTYITVAYDASTPTGKPGTVKVKLTGKGELTGSADETYEIKANWAAFAAFPTTGPKYQVSDIPVPFNGNAKSDLDGLVEPFLLTKDQYDVVATPENNEGTYSTSADVLKNKVDALYAAGRYDLYIIPQGAELTAKYKDAAYIGYYEIDKLSFEKFKDAFIVGKDEEGAFTLTVDKDVYADEFGAILATTADTFTVTIAEKAESSIDGLPGNPFKFAIPTAEPTALEAINLHFDGILYIVIGQTKDLNDYIKAKNKDAAIDFKSFISYSSDEPEKLSIEGSILTAVDKWNGEVTATYTKGSKTIKVTFPVKAVESEDKIPTPPTSVESIVKGGKSVVFAGGELILKGFGGSVATVYGLNGGVVASFAVGSDDAAFGLGLGKGFYLVKVGATVTKFIVK